MVSEIKKISYAKADTLLHKSKKQVEKMEKELEPTASVVTIDD